MRNLYESHYRYAGTLFYSYRRTKTPKDKGSGVTTEYIYFLDRPGLKSAAIWDQVFTWSKFSAVPVYFKNSDGFCMPEQCLTSIPAICWTPEQMWGENRGDMNCTMHSDKFNRCACSRRNVLRTNLELHRCSFFAHVTMALQLGLRRVEVCSGRPGLLGHLCPFPSSPRQAELTETREVTETMDRLWDPEDICEFGTVKQRW